MTSAAADCLALLRDRDQTLATAESLTAGLVSSTLGAVAGASDVLRGGLVAYATDVKARLLGVDAALLAEHGAVSRECAEAMARGARSLFTTDWAVATTGVAGPTEQEGQPVGTVFVAVAWGTGVRSARLALVGERDEIRGEAVERALALLVSTARDVGSAG